MELVYPGGNWKSAEIWNIYRNSNDPMALKSSGIAGVPKRTGRILSERSAGDEG